MIASSNKNPENEIEDPVERMLKKTGCIELHYQVQVCLFELYRCQLILNRIYLNLHIFSKSKMNLIRIYNRIKKMFKD